MHSRPAGHKAEKQESVPSASGKGSPSAPTHAQASGSHRKGHCSVVMKDTGWQCCRLSIQDRAGGVRPLLPCGCCLCTCSQQNGFICSAILFIYAFVLSSDLFILGLLYKS